ncbi:MAG TPA: lytic transglycosylase, partial [Actinoplanes sp.]
ENALVGANYLAWLTKWVENNYFKGSGYSLSTSKCKSHTSWCLLNVVIAGYNAGQGGIEAAAASKKLPKPQYVAAVRSLMARCQCDQY